MRYLLVLFTLAAALTAAEIRIIVINDAGKTVSTTSIATTDAVLKAINEWRQDQLIPGPPPANAPTPAFPTVDAMWKRLIGDWIKRAVADYLDDAKAERAKIQESEQRLQQLRDAAVAP